MFKKREELETALNDDKDWYNLVRDKKRDIKIDSR